MALEYLPLSGWLRACLYGAKTMKITRYKLIVDSKDDLETAVNKLIAEGWQPHGAPVVCSQDRPYELCQALIQVEPAS